jgi:hypothetical protein
MTEHIPTKASEIDVAEAKKYTECSDCEAGLYAYDSREYPGDTGAICFDCLRKRYEKLRDAKHEPGPVAAAVLDRLAAQFKHAVDNQLPSTKVPFKLAEMKAFLDEREQVE